MKNEKLRAYTDGVDTIIAYSADDAGALMAELEGTSIEERMKWYLSDDEDFSDIYGEIEHGIELSICVDERMRDEDIETKTVAEWIKINGRGLLCSTEF